MPLTIRPARPADGDAVFAFCTGVWGGHDYLPRVWDEWLNDPQGLLLVALRDGVPVAVARADLSLPQEAWLEGMRVDPAHRQEGVATALFQAQLEEVARRGVRVVRLMTVGTNWPVHRMCARLGLERVARVRARHRDLQLGAPPAAARPLDLAEWYGAQALLLRPARRGALSFLQATRGLYSRSGGIWTAWNEERLREHLGRGEVWVCEERGRPAALAVLSPHRRRRGAFEIGLLEGPAGACTRLLQALAWRPELPPGEPDSPPRLRLALPAELLRLHRAAAAAGYAFLPGRRGEMWIFERVLLGSGHTVFRPGPSHR